MTVSDRVLEDLSMKHHQVSGIFTLAVSPAEWNRYRLSNKQMEFYEQNGYLAGIRTLDDEPIQIPCEQLKRLVSVGNKMEGQFFPLLFDPSLSL